LWSTGDAGKEVSVPSPGHEPIALCIETSDGGENLRGAIYSCQGSLGTFVFSANPEENDLESLIKTVPLHSNRPLLAWDVRDFRLWQKLLRLCELPKWDGEIIPLRSLARRALKLPAGRITTETLASALQAKSPGDCEPELTAKFLLDCLAPLLDLVPPQHRALGKIPKWLLAEEQAVDFSRFGFDADFLKQIPESPGVYIMRDRTGGPAYVGKSQNLRRRVGSYFSSRALESPKVVRIHEQLHSIELRTAANEVEALLLEMRLIQKLRPSVNLQTAVHPRLHRNRKNLLLLVGGISRGTVAVYFLVDGLFSGRQSARLHRLPDSRLREKIKSAYFQRRPGKKKSADTWRMEIISRWLSQNSRRLNWIDVDEAGKLSEVVRRLGNYLNDADELRNKVYYR
jgi:hypothetical protein